MESKENVGLKLEPYVEILRYVLLSFLLFVEKVLKTTDYLETPCQIIGF